MVLDPSPPPLRGSLWPWWISQVIPVYIHVHVNIYIYTYIHIFIFPTNATRPTLDMTHIWMRLVTPIIFRCSAAHMFMCVCVYVCTFMCVCVYVCTCSTHIHTNTHIYICVYIYSCVFVCMCICSCVFVCMCVRIAALNSLPIYNMLSFVWHNVCVCDV